jgi:hypothetical protein
MHADDQAGNISRALGEAQRFLSLAGNNLAPVETRIGAPKIIEIYLLHKTRKDFCLAPGLRDFQVLAANELVGTDGGQKIYTPEESVLLFAQSQQGPGEEAFQLARFL